MRNWLHKTKTTRPMPHRPADPRRFKRLTDRVTVRDTIASHPVTPARDPEGGRDTNRDFVIRYGDPFDE